MRPSEDSRARFRFNLIGTRSRRSNGLARTDLGARKTWALGRLGRSDEMTSIGWRRFDADGLGGMVDISIDIGDRRAHCSRNRNASAKRPALQFNLMIGTHPGVRCPRTE